MAIDASLARLWYNNAMKSLHLSRPHAIMMVGIPGSGKTTWAKNFVKKNPDYVRINRDDLRNMLIDKWDWSIEDVVKSTQAHMIKSFLEIGKNIVVDSTNLKNNSLIYQAAIDSGCDFDVEYKDFFDISIEECIKRDSLREKPVGKDVIESMYQDLQKLLAREK